MERTETRRLPSWRQWDDLKNALRQAKRARRRRRQMIYEIAFAVANFAAGMMQGGEN